ncbi:MAG: RluA family pseudouridine synthase [Planctomycetota bacterium]
MTTRHRGTASRAPIEWVYDPPAEGPRVVHRELYEADGGVRRGFVVVDKPAGLLAVPGIGPAKADCVRSRVQVMEPQASGPMTCHRLDLSTSGLMILALDAVTHKVLSFQFERRQVKKRYVALVEGHLSRDAGRIDVPMRKDMDAAPKQLVDWDEGKASVSEFTRVAHETRGGRPVTRIVLSPKTGRTHQLRLHCAHPRVTVVGDGPSDTRQIGLGAPIVGDELYGDGADESRPGGAPRLMLHAALLTVFHPHTWKRLSFRSPAPF